MPKIIKPQIGSSINEWTIVDVLEKKGGRTTVLARCRCGTEKSMAYTKIVSGHTKSCGCYLGSLLYPKKFTELTQEALRDILAYDPATGIFRWKQKTAPSVRVGEIAGGLDGDSYVGISIYGATYKAHNLAWLYVHGRMTGHSIDHINRVRDDNRLCNLREATLSMQQHNKNTPNRHPGVQWDKARGKWIVRMRDNGRQLCLGRFDRKSDAIAARSAALSAKLDRESSLIQFVKI